MNERSTSIEQKQTVFFIQMETLDVTLLLQTWFADEKLLFYKYKISIASAVAANNAMAMITRLKGEKAVVQMEALQYQRMMEEQAEYD
ncbi:probable myosin-binding protein 6 [Tanacetum coccineum]